MKTKSKKLTGSDLKQLIREEWDKMATNESADKIQMDLENTLTKFFLQRKKPKNIAQGLIFAIDEAAGFAEMNSFDILKELKRNL